MGWLPRPEPTLTAGGDTWNTKTKLTQHSRFPWSLAEEMYVASSVPVPKVVTREYRLAERSGLCCQFYTHRSLQQSKASHYFQTAAELHLSVHDLCPSKSDKNSFQPKICWCTNITTQSVCTDSLLANCSSNSLVPPARVWSSHLASEEEFGRYRQGWSLFSYGFSALDRGLYTLKVKSNNLLTWNLVGPHYTDTLTLWPWLSTVLLRARPLTVPEVQKGTPHVFTFGFSIAAQS